MTEREWIDRVNRLADGVDQLERDTMGLLWDVTEAVERANDELDKR